MVEELLEQPGSAYDPVLFEFTTDVTNDQTAEGAKRIGPALVDEVRPAFVARRDSYYESRREELHQTGLDMAAVRVATAYRGKAILPEPELEAAVAGDEADRTVAAAALTRMQDFGYVWKPLGQGFNWVPGIPSLMDYVRENPPAANHQAASSSH